MELCVRATSRSSKTQNADYLFINKDVQSECLSNSVDETGQTRSEIWQHVQRHRFGGQTARGKGVRQGNKKSKTGCLTCRIRRIKCDETIPHCRRCTSTGRKCDGPIVQKFRLASDTLERRRHDNNAPAPTTLSGPHSDKPEQRAFDFFLRRVVPVFSGALDLEFWSHSILQISRSEPVVWYAVIAISSLFEYPQYSTSLSVEPGDEALETDSAHRQALKWYNRSISRLREQIEQDAASASVALLSCLLFICVELLQNNIAGALSLFQNGIKMMRNVAQRTSSSATQYGLENQPSSLLIRDTLSAFLRVGVMPVSGSCTQQYEGIISPESVSNEANSWQLTEMLEYGPEQAESVDLFNLDTDLGSPLDRLADARQALQALMTDCYTVIQVGESCKNMLHQNPNQVAALSSRQHTLKSKLRAWHSRFSGFNASFRHAATSKQLWTSSILLLYYHVTLIWLSTCLSPYETSYDEHIYLFEAIINHATAALAFGVGSDDSQPPFILEGGVAPPLYFTASKCRQPVVRGKAISLLKKAPRRESVWKSLSAARIAERVQQYEEEGLVQHEVPDASFSTMTLPEESKRVHNIKILQDIPAYGTRPIRFRATRYYRDANGVRQRAVDILSTPRC